jgi:hypothetical protein
MTLLIRGLDRFLHVIYWLGKLAIDEIVENTNAQLLLVYLRERSTTFTEFGLQI